MALKVKPSERVVRVCLDGTLVAEYQKVTAELDNKRKRKLVDNRLNDPVVALERRQAELWEKQEAETVSFHLRALPRHEWDKLKLDHPAREDDELDSQYGFNTSTIFDAALSRPGVIVEVTNAGGEREEFSHNDWLEFSKDLSSGQFTDFQVAINELNGGQAEVPFSLPGYKKIQDSGANSK